MPISALVVIAAIALVAIAWRFVTGGRGDARFVLRVKGPGRDGIELRGDVPGLGGDELVDFVASLELPTGATIWGIPDRDRLMLRFSAEVPEGPAQRIRNLVLSRYR